MMYLPPPVNIRATAGKKKSMGSSIAQSPMEVREKMAALCGERKKIQRGYVQPHGEVGKARVKLHKNADLSPSSSKRVKKNGIPLYPNLVNLKSNTMKNTLQR